MRIEAHDTSFYSALQLKREFGVDHEAVRAYFPLDHVVETTMQIYQELLGLVFEEILHFDTWHTLPPKRAPRPCVEEARRACASVFVRRAKRSRGFERKKGHEP